MISFILKCLGLSGFLLLLILIGRLIGLRAKGRKASKEKLSLGSVISAILVLLSFILALTYSMVAGRFSARKQLLLDDVNAIETVYLRSDMLSSKNKLKAKLLIKEYVIARVSVRDKLISDPGTIQRMASRFDKIHSELWDDALKDESLRSDSTGKLLYLSSLNQMFDTYATRYSTALQLRLQPVTWGVLAVMTLVSMIAVGFEFGLTGISSRSIFIVAFLFALMLSVLILYLQELDSPGVSKVVIISQQPLEELSNKIHIGRID